MLEGFIVWGAFSVFGGIIIYAGPRLSRYGDAIAEKTGMQTSWIGVVLLALVTSLPEVATSSTAALIDLPDVVFGNVFGSNLFNVLIIAILDIMTPRPPMLQRASRSNLLISNYGIMMMAVALIPMVLYNVPGLPFAPLKIFGLIDVSSILIIGMYLAGMRMIFIQQHAVDTDDTHIATAKKYEDMSVRGTYGMFVLYAAVIIGSGVAMSLLADRISAYEIPIGGGQPIGQSLVGIILLAVVTSLPELMVSIGAVRLGAIDMAVGNVLGSNMFNMLIIGISDFFYASGSILNRPTIIAAERITGLGSHLLVGLAGIIMLGIASARISYLGKTRGRICPSSWTLIVVFVATYVFLFLINFA